MSVEECAEKWATAYVDEVLTPRPGMPPIDAKPAMRDALIQSLKYAYLAGCRDQQLSYADRIKRGLSNFDPAAMLRKKDTIDA